jgi:hypothetical protein
MGAPIDRALVHFERWIGMKAPVPLMQQVVVETL